MHRGLFKLWILIIEYFDQQDATAKLWMKLNKLKLEDLLEQEFSKVTIHTCLPFMDHLMRRYQLIFFYKKG